MYVATDERSSAKYKGMRFSNPLVTKRNLTIEPCLEFESYQYSDMDLHVAGFCSEKYS